MTHDHDHDHDHDHHHPQPQPEVALRTEALEALLAERGLVSSDAIDAVVELYENDVGPQNGARVVAHAWADPAYRARLLENGTPAVYELGFDVSNESIFVSYDTALGSPKEVTKPMLVAIKGAGFDPWLAKESWPDGAKADVVPR